MNSTLIIILYSVLTIVFVYLLISTRLQHWVYSLILMLCFGSVIGSLFGILQLQGRDVLLLIGFVGTFIGAGLLIWKSFRNSQHQIIFNKLIGGIIIILQMVLFIFLPAHADKSGLLNYPVTAFLATVVINEQYDHVGERNILILFILQGLLYILIDVLSFF